MKSERLLFICTVKVVAYSEFREIEFGKIQTFAPDNKHLVIVKNNVLSTIACAKVCLELLWNCSTFLFQEETNTCSIYSIQLPPVQDGIYTAYINETGAPVSVLEETPFNGNTDLARHKCTSFSSEPPKSSCPISQRINGSWTSASVSCSVHDIFNQSALQYDGRVACTVSGVTCQRWNTNTPHTPSFYAGRSDLENWCRLSSEPAPWCYTTDPNVRWDYCPTEVYECKQPPPTPSVSGTNVTLERPYQNRDIMAKFSCTSFTSPEPISSCPVTLCGGVDSWTKATVSCSVKDCFDESSEAFKGRVSCTRSGIPCQYWNSSYPHDPVHFVGRSDLENRCQISNDTSRPWCYTTDPEYRWDYCPVDDC